MENQICKNCGHHKAFHHIGVGNCVHGLIVREDGVNYTDACTCKKFQSEEIDETIKQEIKEQIDKDYALSKSGEQNAR